MNKMQKNNLYDEVCRVLTEFEYEYLNKSNDYLREVEHDEMNNEEWLNYLYVTLVKIVNAWEELTGDDE